MMIKRVLVAMSGGVDSSVAAALLVAQGHAVEGVTMKLSPGVCCDIASAASVCERLAIPHRVLDAQTRFSRDIIDHFIAEYHAGRTPNPCIRCNDLVKFELLLDYARREGFDALATGHYARIEPGVPPAALALMTAIDQQKDQSYFLYRLTQERMRSLLFPLGTLLKSEVRRLAAEKGLPSAERPESQEVCFIPNDDYRAYIKEQAPEALAPGDLVLTDGRRAGRHEGIALFTVGQRRGLGVSAGERLYVVRIEPESNRVVLGRRADLATTEVFVSEVNLIAQGELPGSFPASVKIRYRSKPAAAVISPAGRARARITFNEPVYGLCPGQSAVFYDGDRVIGGGVIDTPQKAGS